jgi:hypothetical protein
MLRATYYNKGSSIVCVGGKEYSTAYYDIVQMEEKFAIEKELLLKKLKC